MTADLDAALAAATSIPTPRTPDGCGCAGCLERRHRDIAAQEWRALDEAVRAARQLRNDDRRDR